MLVITFDFILFFASYLELKHVLENLELENNELEGLKLQHDQKVNELEKIQAAILEVSMSSVADTVTGRRALHIQCFC